MGMTIDKCLWELRTMRAGIKCGLQYEETDEDKEIDREQIEALQMAIDTIRKYQEIKQIAFPLQFCSTDKLEHEAIMKICGVLEDGNDD